MGAAGRGCSYLSCTNRASGESIPTEYAEHTEPSGGDVPPTDCTDAHRLGRYGIPVIPTPTTEQTTNTGSANRRRLRQSCRSHSNMTYSSSRQLAMPTKTISHRLHRTHRKAGGGDSSGGIPANAASKNISHRLHRTHRKAGCGTAHRTHSCCGGGRRPPLLTKRTQNFCEF